MAAEGWSGTSCRKIARYTCSSRGDGSTPEPFREQVPGVGVDGQRVRLAADGGEGAHEEGARAFGQRVGGGQLAELADQAARLAERQVRLDPVKHRGGPQLLEPRGGRRGEILLGHIGERRTAPGGERLAQQADGRRRVARLQGAAARAGGPLEGHGVHRLRRHRQPVARRGGLQHAVVDSRLAERGAQPGDQGLQGVGSVRGALVGPEPLDQLVRRHHAARVQGKQDQQRAHPVAADPHRAAVAIVHLERAEHADTHGYVATLLPAVRYQYHLTR